MEPMRVLMVSRASYRLPESQGGPDAYALRTATYLVPQGHEVFLVGQGHPGPAFGEVRFVRVPTNIQVTSRIRFAYFLKAFLLNIASVLTALRFLWRNRDQVDIVHCNSNLTVVLMSLLGPKKPLIYTMHDPLAVRGGVRPGPWLERLLRPLINGLFERWALHRSAHVIALSSEIRKQAEEVIGDTSKLTLVYPLSRPAPPTTPRSGPQKPILRQYVLSVGAQTGRKRFDLLIRALPRIPSAIGLVLVGSGSDRLRLGRCAREVGVADRVVFLDRVSDAELSGLYRDALVYALASSREGLPATVIEAALSGTPTLYFTDAPHPDLEGSPSDYLRVIQSLDPQPVADAINRAVARDSKAVPDRRQIAQWARSRFPPPEVLAGAIGRIYAGVAEPALLPEGTDLVA
jgi:glycosyltransferase involved in cell wall biosynthesis